MKMTKNEKVTDIIMEYQLIHADYDWYKSHKYVFSAIAANDYSVIQPYTPTQVSKIKEIYTTWVRAMELATKIGQETKYNRSTRSY